MHTSGADNAKIIASCVLLGMTCLIGGLGLPPFVILAVGAYTGVRSRNEGNVYFTTKIIQSLVGVIVVGAAGIGAYNSYMFNAAGNSWDRSNYREASQVAYAIAASFLAYLLVLEFGWKRPLCRKISTMGRAPRRAASIIKRQSMHAYSVSEELTRWKRLHDEGAISVEEYDAVKRDLLRGISDQKGQPASVEDQGDRREVAYDGNKLRGGMPRATHRPFRSPEGIEDPSPSP